MIASTFADYLRGLRLWATNPIDPSRAAMLAPQLPAPAPVINAEPPAPPNPTPAQGQDPPSPQKRSQPREAGDDGQPYGIPLDDWDRQVAHQLEENRNTAEKAGLAVTEHWILGELTELSKTVSPLRAAQLMFGTPR